MAYLARANVALSVLLTMCSTLAAVVMTPLLTGSLAGAYVPVDAWGIFSPPRKWFSPRSCSACSCTTKRRA